MDSRWSQGGSTHDYVKDDDGNVDVVIIPKEFGSSNTDDAADE